MGVTLELYAHLAENAQDSAAAAMDRLLWSGEEPPQAANS
jgi:hypothetical protein